MILIARVLAMNVSDTVIYSYKISKPYNKVDSLNGNFALRVSLFKYQLYQREHLPTLFLYLFQKPIHGVMKVPCTSGIN